MVNILNQKEVNWYLYMESVKEKVDQLVLQILGQLNLEVPSPHELDMFSQNKHLVPLPWKLISQTSLISLELENKWKLMSHKKIHSY